MLRLTAGFTSFFILLFSVYFVSCKRTHSETLCPPNSCSWDLTTDGFVRKKLQTKETWLRVTAGGLKEIPFLAEGETPVAYYAKGGLMLAKSSGMDGLSLALYEMKDNDKAERKAVSPFPAEQLISACISSRTDLWMLHAEASTVSSGKQYVLSLSDGLFGNWENFFLMTEAEDERSMGDAIEKPVKLICDNDGRVYLVTYLYYRPETMMLANRIYHFIQVLVYRFDRQEKEIEHVANFIPRTKGQLMPFYFPAIDRFYAFQEGKISVQTGYGMPDERPLLPGSKGMVFSEEGRQYMFLAVPLEGGGIDARIVPE